MKKIVSIVISMSAFLVLTSCDVKDEKYKIKDKELNVITALSNSYQNGIVYTNKDTCFFYDYASNISVPLCLKPNCTHKDDTCISKIITTSGCGTEHAVIYNDSIYFFTETESIEGEGKNTTYNIQSVLHKCDLKSGEIKDVLNISDLNCISSVNMVLDGNTVYFTASNAAYQFEDGTWLNAGSGKQYLCSVNLTNNSFENYGLVNDNEFASNNVIITENSINAVADQVIISGVYSDKIYLYYQYVEDKNIIIDAIENSNSNINWKYEVKEFDLSTKKLNITHQAQPICMNDDWYVTEDKSDKKIIAMNREGNSFEFDSLNELQFDCYQYSIYNDKIWDLYNGYVYDLSTSGTFKISEDFLGGNIADYISNDNKYVVCNYDSKDSLSYSMVGENILINK